MTSKRLMLAAAALVAALAVVPDALATFPGHNGLIAFSADTGSGAQLYTVRPNGKDLRQITRLDGDAVNADWSPDGRQIAFELDTADTADVLLVRPDGSGLVDLTSVLGCCNGQPSFTPDGNEIVFERFDLATLDDAVWIMNADGSDPHRIVDPFPDGTGLATDPNVSPDGATLSFVGFDNSLFGPPPNFEPAQGLFTSNLDGSNQQQLLPFSADLAIKQDWAPNGKRLLVGVNANFFQPDKPANIATIRPDGTDFTPLTSSQDRAVSAFAGSYSPDGNWVVLRLEDHGQFGLFRIHPGGGNLHQILPLSDFRPRFIDWGPRTRNDNDDGDDGD